MYCTLLYVLYFYMSGSKSVYYTSTMRNDGLHHNLMTTKSQGDRKFSAPLSFYGTIIPRGPKLLETLFCGI
jgi:hypothetical protein